MLRAASTSPPWGGLIFGGLGCRLLAHGDCVVFGRALKELSDANTYRAVDFATFWEEEVQVKEGWKDRAKIIGLDGRCEVTLFHNLPRLPSDGDARGIGTWANVKPLLQTLLHPSESSTFSFAAPAKPTIEIQVLTNPVTAVPQLPPYAPGANGAPLFREIIGGILDRLDGPRKGRSRSRPTFPPDQTVSVYPRLSEEMKDQLLAETINALTAIGGHDNPPARHIVGHEAVGLVKEKLKTVSEELEEFVEVSCAVDLDADVANPQ
ncbi:MAG: hypothetical protein Q9184_003734 [Pyrenodesmia sp. 2 TL-2023]